MSAKPKPVHIAPLRGPRDGGVKEGHINLAIPPKGMTIVPGGSTPNRKWFANLIAVAIAWVIVKLGLDSATAASIAAPAAGLAANYAWSEWRSLPDTIRGILRKLTGPLRRG